WYPSLLSVSHISMARLQRKAPFEKRSVGRVAWSARGESFHAVYAVADDTNQDQPRLSLCWPEHDAVADCVAASWIRVMLAYQYIRVSAVGIFSSSSLRGRDLLAGGGESLSASGGTAPKRLGRVSGMIKRSIWRTIRPLLSRKVVERTTRLPFG